MTFPNNSVITASGWNKQNIYLSIYQLSPQPLTLWILDQITKPNKCCLCCSTDRHHIVLCLFSIFLNLVPSAPRQIVRAVNKTSTSILITLYEVPFGQKNGHILSYNVTYTLVNQNVTTTKQIEAPTLQVNLTGLRANTNYSITVVTSTIKGHGPASPAIYVSTQKEGE